MLKALPQDFVAPILLFSLNPASSELFTNGLLYSHVSLESRRTIFNSSDEPTHLGSPHTTHTRTSLLHRSVLVDAVDVALVQVDEKHQVVPEDRQPVHGGHFDDEGEQICTPTA
jgi:hypothetical protein